MHLNKRNLTILTIIILCNVLSVFVFSQIFADADSQHSNNFTKFVKDPVKHIIKFKNLGALVEKGITYVNGFHNTLQESLNPMLTEFLLSSDPSKCSQDFQYVIENLQSVGWATEMLDSYGKPESGLFVGNTKWLGEYDECLRIYAPPKVNTNVGNFHGRYCTLTIHTRLQNRLVPFKVGVCLPDSCNPSGSIFNYMQMNLNGSYPEIEEEINSFLKETKITCQQTEREYNFDDIAVMYLMSLFGLLAVIGSLITVYKYLIKAYFEKDCTCEANAFENPSVNVYVEKMSGRGSEDVMINGNSQKRTLPVWLEKWNSFFNCFCFLTNGEKILNCNTEGQLPCLHGIRFLSMCWIILGHTYTFNLDSIRNPVEALDAMDKWHFQLIINGLYAVDSFFLLSGFLVAYNFFKKMDKSNDKTNWVYFYVHRYLRLTPVYMIVLAFTATLNSHLGSGPIWSPSEVESSCKESWWWHTLYINNFHAMANQCMGYTWYLANDMQFYIISPLFLVTLWWWPKIGCSVMGLFFSIPLISSFALTYKYDLFTGLGNIAEKVAHIEQSSPRWTQSYEMLYIKPYTRVGPYLVGISLAYFVCKRKQTNRGKLNWVILSVGWIVTTVVTLACIFGIYHRSLTVVAASFYNALNHVLFVCSLSWVIFLCITGQAGPVNSILSWKVWVPLSRLTYCAYLVHPIIMHTHNSTLRILLEFSQMTMIMIFLGFLVISYGIALSTSLLFEWPVIRLESYLKLHPKCLYLQRILALKLQYFLKTAPHYDLLTELKP